MFLIFIDNISIDIQLSLMQKLGLISRYRTAE